MYFEKIITDGDIIIDATCGNGHDTLYLAKLTPSGKVYAFDIQKEAVDNTKALLLENRITNAEIILDSHHKMDEYVKEDVKMVVFNLGYLPGADKSVTTKADTTAVALKNALELTKNGGYISICAYLGHDGAVDEYEEMMNILSELKNREYNVLKMSHENRKRTSPVYVLVERL